MHMHVSFFSHLHIKDFVIDIHVYDTYDIIPLIHTKPTEEIFTAIAFLSRSVYTLPCTAMFSTVSYIS